MCEESAFFPKQIFLLAMLVGMTSFLKLVIKLDSWLLPRRSDF
jgi:hypothetical protein